jgi:hypothetical protein
MFMALVAVATKGESNVKKVAIVTGGSFCIDLTIVEKRLLQKYQMFH